MSDAVAFILTRMTSKRLPGKALVDICGQPNLARMIDRVRMSRRIGKIVIATTVNATDDPIVALCRDLGVEYFRGDEMDVLGRVHDAALAFRADPVIRLTADCPMIDPQLIDECIDMFTSGDYDYVANGHVRSYPDGLDVEVMSFAALARAHREADHPFAREHVTPYIRGSHPQYGTGNFRVGNKFAPANFGHVRWTLDTAEDLDIIRTLVSRLPDKYTWLDALSESTKEPRLLGLKQKS